MNSAYLPKDFDVWMEDADGWNGVNDGPSANSEKPGPRRGWKAPRPRGPMSFDGGFRNKRYQDAYGDYSGGYYPAGGPPGPGFYSFDMPPPPEFGFSMGRGYGPNGPPLSRPRVNNYERILKFLTRCGMTKDQARSLPQPLLDLIRPQHCALCAVDFETFPLARLHYASKNHLKNQKKWMNQRFGEPRYANKREGQTPMKARELYCELCDVHITSKVHAESHYAGRPHRAIVERRRTPKNPFLNTPGMEKRVEQLIRREKKNLKAVEEKVVVEEPEVVAEVKPVPPELYCNICKTSVTNSEQMTMHMNGKKHLQREKQHIFQFMKGEPKKKIDGAQNAEVKEECPIDVDADEEADAEADVVLVADTEADVVLVADAEADAGAGAEAEVEVTPELDESTEEWQNGGGEEWGVIFDYHYY